MTYGHCCRSACLLLLLCGACGDDDAAVMDAPATGRRDGGSGDDRASSRDASTSDDEPGGGAAGDGDAPSDASVGSDSGSKPPIDAATPPAPTPDASSTPDDPSDAPDGAVEVTDCASLSACCEQLNAGLRRACMNAVEIADDAACVEVARVACSGGGTADGGRPVAMPCEEVLECCSALEGRQQIACEAAAAAPEGRACDRAVAMFCP